MLSRCRLPKTEILNSDSNNDGSTVLVNLNRRLNSADPEINVLHNSTFVCSPVMGSNAVKRF